MREIGAMGRRGKGLVLEWGERAVQKIVTVVMVMVGVGEASGGT
jgi:hypothetical protein